MAVTFFLDLEAGDDNNSGDSFTVTATGTDGATAGTSTFTSASASFTSALIGRYINIVGKGEYAITAAPSGTTLTLGIITGSGLSNPTTASGLTYNIGGRVKTFATGLSAARIVPGDTIRIMASPNPTDTGQTALWTAGPVPAVISIGSSTNASPIAMTVTSHGYSTGDRVLIASHTTNTNANGFWTIIVTGTNTFTLNGSTGNGVGGASGTVRKVNPCFVMLQTGAVTKHIDRCETLWTASSNVTSTVTASCKEGVGAANHVIATAFTTGLAAYKATGTIDLSAYKQVSFWIFNTVAIPASSLSIRLCTDTVGATSVHTITCPAIPSANVWVPITVNVGSALNSAIASVALYIDSDFGPVTIILDNILACKDATSVDSITLQSLISQNSGAGAGSDELWWAIQSIDDAAIKLEQGSTVSSNQQVTAFYNGLTNQTVELYKRETIKPGMLAGNSNLYDVRQEAGTDFGTLITYSGGWDRTAMSSQSGATFIDGLNGQGTGLQLGSVCQSWDLIGAVRFTIGISWANTFSGGIIGTIWGICCLSTNINPTIGVFKGTALYSTQGGSQAGITINGFNSTFSKVICAGGVYFLLNGCIKLRVMSGSAIGCAQGISVGTGAGICEFYNFIMSNNTIRDVSAGSTDIYFKNCLFGSTTEALQGSNGKVFSINHDQTVGNHQIFTDGGLISSNVSVRHTASGISWVLQPTSTSRSSAYPLPYVLGVFPCAANAAVTVSLWMRRDSTSLTGMLVIRGGQIAGVASDVTDTMTASANTWEQRSITFTPTEAGGFEIEVWAYGGTTNSLYIDDFSISQ